MGHEGIFSLEERVRRHLEKIYPDLDTAALSKRVTEVFDGWISDSPPLELQAEASLSDLKVHPDRVWWSQEDIVLITYGNSIVEKDKIPLKTLDRFLKTHLKDQVSIVHILPFFPYSSDDGFAVMDYYEVNPSLGDWEDIRRIAEEFKLMSDLVINHTSSRAAWFENFRNARHPGKDYYISVDPDSDLSQVVRPRTSPLLREIKTPDGIRHVWCTFSHDQVDLDFKNPEVLLEFLRIIRFYLEKGVQVFRLDAVAFLWKEIHSSCLHLDQTHEIIKLFRTLVDHFCPYLLLLTETNVPSEENLSYLGKGDEAHVIYNFPLPPLLLNTLVSGNSEALVKWMTSVPHLMPGNSCLNFIASHDGIGLRPVEGFLKPDEIDRLIQLMKSFGGKISTRALNDQEDNPYEINISLWDALKGTLKKGPDQWQLKRFVCAHAVMFCLQGIPAVYIHSLLGTQNDYRRMENLQSNRAINRHIWDADLLAEKLTDQTSHHFKVFQELKNLMSLRSGQAAFHPQAGQLIINGGSRLVIIYRVAQSLRRRKGESILCIHNISEKTVKMEPSKIFPIDFFSGVDLIGKELILKTDRPIDIQPYDFLWVKRGHA